MILVEALDCMRDPGKRETFLIWLSKVGVSGESGKCVLGSAHDQTDRHAKPHLYKFFCTTMVVPGPETRTSRTAGWPLEGGGDDEHLGKPAIDILDLPPPTPSPKLSSSCANLVLASRALKLED